MPDFTRPVPSEDIAKVEAYAEQGWLNRTSHKARKLQRSPSDLFRANYGGIEWHTSR